MTEVPDGVGLAAAVEGLRDELEEAWRASQGRPVRFRASEVTLTVQTVARLEKDGSGKIRWWLVEAGGGAKSASESTQTLMLTLTPMLYDEAGGSGPLDVAGDQAQPGG
jgi:hypothetical protein